MKACFLSWLSYIGLTDRTGPRTVRQKCLHWRLGSHRIETGQRRWEDPRHCTASSDTPHTDRGQDRCCLRSPRLPKMKYHWTAIDTSCRIEQNRKRRPRYFYGLCSKLKSITNMSLYVTVSAVGKQESKEIAIKQTGRRNCALHCGDVFRWVSSGHPCNNRGGQHYYPHFPEEKTKVTEKKYFPRVAPSSSELDPSREVQSKYVLL